MAEKKHKRQIARSTGCNISTGDNFQLVAKKAELAVAKKKHYSQRCAQTKKEPQKHPKAVQHLPRVNIAICASNDIPMKPRPRTNPPAGKKKVKRNNRITKIDNAGKKLGVDSSSKFSIKSKHTKHPKQKQTKKQLDRTSSLTKTKISLDKTIVPIGQKNIRQKPSPMRIKEMQHERCLVLAKNKDGKMAMKSSPTKSKDVYVEKKNPVKSYIQLQKIPSPMKLNLQKPSSPTKLSLLSKPSPTSLLQKKNSPVVNKGVRLMAKPSPKKTKEPQKTPSPTKIKFLKKAKTQNKDKYPSDRLHNSKTIKGNLQSKPRDEYDASNTILEICTAADLKEQILSNEATTKHKPKSPTKSVKKIFPVTKMVDEKGVEPKSKRIPSQPLRESTAGYSPASPFQNTNSPLLRLKANKSPTHTDSRSEKRGVPARKVASNAHSDTLFRTAYATLPIKNVSKCSGFLSKYSSETVATKNLRRRNTSKKNTSSRKADLALDKPPKGIVEASHIASTLHKIALQASEEVQKISSSLEFEMYANSKSGLFGSKHELTSISSSSIFLGPGSSSSNSGNRLTLKKKISATPCLPLPIEPSSPLSSPTTLQGSSVSDDTGETVIEKQSSTHTLLPESGEPFSKALVVQDSTTTTRTNRPIIKKMEVIKRSSEGWTDTIRRLKRSPPSSGSSIVHSHTRHRVAPGTRRAGRRELLSPTNSSRQVKKSKAPKKKNTNHDSRLPITITSITPVPGPEPSVDDPVLIGHTKVQLKSILKRGPPPTTFKIGLSDSAEGKTARPKRSVHWSPSTELLELANEANRIGRLRRVPSGPLMYLI